METVDPCGSWNERTREGSVNAAHPGGRTCLTGSRSGPAPVPVQEIHSATEIAMSSRLEDLKFLFTLSAVVLFGSGVDLILR